MSQDQGDTPHDAADKGHPLKIGGKAATGVPSAVADGDRVNSNFDEFGNQRVLLVAPDGTDLITTDGVKVQGNVAHDAVDSGNPVKIGGKASTSVPSAVADADRVDAYLDEYGKQGVFLGGASTNVVVVAQTPADGLANSTVGLVTGARIALFNETTTDRMRGNTEVTVLASAARTATVSSADLTNYNARGVIITIDVTVDGAAASITPTVEIKDSVGGLYDVIMSMTAVAAVGTFVYVIYPSTLTAAANGITQILQNPLPRTWRVTMTAADADSITYSISAAYIL